MAIYGRILRVPGVAVLIMGTTLTRLPFAINGLAVILFMREATGSFATAGLVAGSLALGAGLGSPFAARLVDRRGAVWLLPLAVAHGAAILALWGLGEVDAPAAVAGGDRARRRRHVPAVRRGAALALAGAAGARPELVRGAYAFDSVTIEISFVSGPLITAALVALSGPRRPGGLVRPRGRGTVLFLSRLPHAAARYRRASTRPGSGRCARRRCG